MTTTIKFGDLKAARAVLTDPEVSDVIHSRIRREFRPEHAAAINETMAAAEVLIEIASAAKAWRSASKVAAAARLKLARATERADINFGYAQVDELHRREAAARDAMDAALDKVEL